MASWDPDLYLHFDEARSRPFADLVAQIGANAPQRVVDLGCGPGQLTATLAARWPSAQIDGLDSSESMIEASAQHASERVSFVVGDLTQWSPCTPYDVIVSNATLQWVPGHRALLPRLLKALSPEGWLAFQVPGNFDQPSHRLLHELATDPRFAAATRQVERPHAFDAATYLADLTALGCRVDAWETTYLHVLSGVDPVFTWISGTGARPVLQALAAQSSQLRAEFEEEYKVLLREAYPPNPAGTLLPFRRIFVVARTDESQ